MAKKTIEIHSTHIATISLCTRKDEQRKVTFEDRGDGIGRAMVDEDEAEILLGGIGAPEYFKPSFETEPAPAAQKKADAEAAKAEEERRAALADEERAAEDAAKTAGTDPEA